MAEVTRKDLLDFRFDEATTSYKEGWNAALRAFADRIDPLPREKIRELHNRLKPWVLEKLAAASASNSGGYISI